MLTQRTAPALRGLYSTSVSHALQSRVSILPSSIRSIPHQLPEVTLVFLTSIIQESLANTAVLQSPGVVYI